MVQQPLYFAYGATEVEYLKARDVALARAIEAIGPVRREVIPDLFAALVNSIVGQQISTKAHVTIWGRMCEGLGEVTPQVVMACSDEELQRFGLTFRKVGYIKGVAARVLSGEFDLAALDAMSDEQVCKALSALPGIGVWTAEMLMIFSMQRPDVVSFGDLGIQRGMRMLYHHRRITPELFAKYARRYSPYGSVASLYLWAIAGGALPEMRDYAPKKKPMPKKPAPKKPAPKRKPMQKQQPAPKQESMQEFTQRQKPAPNSKVTAGANSASKTERV